MPIFQKLTLITVALLLCACVTTTDSRFSKKASPEKAVESYVALGLGYLRSGDMVMARRKIERALKIDPDSAGAHNAMALFWQERGEIDLARKEFVKAVALDDEYSPARYHYGRFLMSQGQLQSACEHIKFATDDIDYAGRVVAHEDLGLCYGARQEWTQALDTFEKAWQLDSNSTVSSLNLTKIYIDRKRFDLASRWYQRFESVILKHKVKHSAQSLWLGVQIAMATRDKKAEARYAVQLKKRFPRSQEFKQYKRLKGMK